MNTNNTFLPVTQRFILDQDIINELRSRKPEFGFNGLGELVFRRTYSRDNEDWADVVIRVVQGCLSIRKEHFYRNSLRWVDSEWQPFARELANSMFSMEWLPPGRGLWMMGTDYTYERGSMALNNCFSRDTTFWTDKGVKSFNDFEDNTPVVVYGRNGWTKACVHSFDNQKIWELLIEKRGVRKIIHTTGNHRWLAKILNDDANNFDIVTTDKLISGKHILETMTERISYERFMCPIGIQHGIVYGYNNMSKVTNSQNGNTSVVLINDKKDLCKFFSLFIGKKWHEGDINHLPSIWTKLPNDDINIEYLHGFIAGWFAVCGTVEENALGITVEMTTKTITELQWLRNALFGMLVTSEDISFNNVHKIWIDHDQLPQDFFILTNHIEILGYYTQKDIHWKVVNVTQTDRVEKVWCVVELKYQEFTLENGILTKNCGAVDTEEDLVLAAEWTMDSLMTGVGVGFNTKWRGEATMPDKNNTELYIISDSREGWVESLIKLLCAYINSPRYGKCKFPIFDYSQIRPTGLPIKGFGGTASGPEPLKKMHQRIEGYLNAFCNRWLKCKSKVWKEVNPGDWQEVEVNVDKPYSHTRLIADIMNSIGACVVAGNVRRCLPGNAMVHTRKGLVPIRDVNTGMEVLTMNGYEKVTNKFNQGVQRLMRVYTNIGHFDCTDNHRMAVMDNNNYTWKMAKNLTNEDKLIVSTKEIEGNNTQLPIWHEPDLTIPKLDDNMAWFLGLFYLLGESIDKLQGKLYKKVCSQIRRFRCVDRSKLLKYLRSVYSYRYTFSETVNNTKIPHWILNAKTHIKMAYITGMIDSQINAWDLNSGTLFTGKNDKLLIEIQGLLHSCGIVTKLYGNSLSIVYDEDLDRINSIEQLSRKINCNNQLLCRGNDGYVLTNVISLSNITSEYTYDIEVENRHEFFCNGYLTHNSAEICMGLPDDEDFVNLKNYELHPERAEIGWMSNNSVVLRSDEEFRDFGYISEIAERIKDNGEPGIINLHNMQKYARMGDESPDHAFLTNPCGEICLSSHELCNLSEVMVPRCINPDRFYKAIEYATFYSSTVSLLLTHRPETNSILCKNRRIGVSLSGLAQWFSNAVPDGWGDLDYTKICTYLRKGYKLVKNTNINLASLAGVPPSIRVTTVKPSGSISLLAGCTPGVHYPVSRYVIRRVRLGKTSPLLGPLIAAGVPHEDDKFSDNTVVFEFVVDHGNVRPADKVPAWEQLSMCQTLQKHWSDNSVSCTIYFDKEKEGNDIGKLLSMYIPYLKTVSMLPHSGHNYQQAPYEPIPEEEYHSRLSKFVYPEYSDVSGVVPVGSKFCDGDKCTL